TWFSRGTVCAAAGRGASAAASATVRPSFAAHRDRWCEGPTCAPRCDDSVPSPEVEGRERTGCIAGRASMKCIGDLTSGTGGGTDPFVVNWLDHRPLAFERLGYGV